ncbi:tRNA (cmo5U34)-methyltransferase [Anoxybacillus vitaminiphilus]|jgi:tRNA (cmo5U34)-methyltransferase|uniref:tRNA (Cmo5U34)-methyltransferase n=1 Tax=Paranoxybacillus vitaminiphilus TaxID=581036 RepID=A0A327YAA2_9BACL|nr:class I SAM-dependent methyltransferase [Anoxybacillus vitaminiphilus]RAK17351.1 tRNA (cmo5U34)-methyltransferase [Anoxybacillus vitaminiphilus]
MPCNDSRDCIAEKFNENAAQYDRQRRKLIPCFNDFYSIPVSVMNTAKTVPAILDMGAGTGLFTSFILEKYPRANITLIDISEKMMEIAKKRFANYPNVNYIVDDYTKHEFNTKFDMIVSSLSIHHLTDDEKKSLYRRVYSLLNEDGLFLNADQVLGHTPFIDALYKNDWQNKIENSGLTREEIDSAYERTKLDKMSTLHDQLNWLKESGFEDVDCIYKYFNFVVLFGRKINRLV